ncbi:hypothetical protein AB0B66_42775 [Catellatospora sp. NPDC049111]|uniref:hypothetical protein n=1 Tax=Catellatospora sp. NPDC049111 TaxID=3155271 RepID=UPI0033DF7C7A
MDRRDRRSAAPPSARPGRRALVAPDLTALTGPTSGVAVLPHRLFWQADRRVELDNPHLLQWMYETVLREASTTEELRAWLDGPTLVRLWPQLFLPRGVRQAWEQRHPALRAADRRAMTATG